MGCSTVRTAFSIALNVILNYKMYSQAGLDFLELWSVCWNRTSLSAFECLCEAKFKGDPEL